MLHTHLQHFPVQGLSHGAHARRACPSGSEIARLRKEFFSETLYEPPYTYVQGGSLCKQSVVLSVALKKIVMNFIHQKMENTKGQRIARNVDVKTKKLIIKITRSVYSVIRKLRYGRIEQKYAHSLLTICKNTHVLIAERKTQLSWNLTITTEEKSLQFQRWYIRKLLCVELKKKLRNVWFDVPTAIAERRQRSVDGIGFLARTRNSLLNCRGRQRESLTRIVIAGSMQPRHRGLGKRIRRVQVQTNGIRKGLLHCLQTMRFASVQHSEFELKNSCLHRNIVTQEESKNKAVGTGVPTFDSPASSSRQSPRKGFMAVIRRVRVFPGSVSPLTLLSRASQSWPSRRTDHHTLIGPEVLDTGCVVTSTGILPGL